MRASAWGNWKEVESLLNQFVPKISAAEEKLFEDRKKKHSNCVKKQKQWVEKMLQVNSSPQEKIAEDADPAFAKTVEKMRARKMFLELRESSIRKNALHACICGARLIDTRMGLSGWPLHVRGPADIIDHVKCAQLLLDAGANIEAKDILGVTPLHAAAGNFASPQSIRIAQLLVEKGADTKTATTRQGGNWFGQAVQNDNEDVLIELLGRLGMDLEAQTRTISIGRLLPSRTRTARELVRETGQRKNLKIVDERLVLGPRKFKKKYEKHLEEWETRLRAECRAAAMQQKNGRNSGGLFGSDPSGGDDMGAGSSCPVQ